MKIDFDFDLLVIFLFVLWFSYLGYLYKVEENNQEKIIVQEIIQEDSCDYNKIN